MIQQVGIGQAKFTAHPTETEVAHSENQAANTSGDQGSRTHYAWLHSGIHRGRFEPVILQLGRGIPQGKDFRVSRRIARSDRRITAAPANLAIHYQYGAHWDFAIPLGLARKFQRLAHELLVFSVHEVGGAAEVWMSIS